MRTVLALPFIVLSFGVSALTAQSPSSTPTGGPTTSPQQPQLVPRAARPAQVFSERFGTTSLPTNGLSARQLIVQRYAAQLYRKPTEKELLTMAPKPELIRRWAAFLALPDTGVTRLVPEAGCGENAVVISAAEECLEFTMPGGGSSYSFRAERYRIKHLADITYTNGELRATGLLMHVILVDLGDHPVDELTLASEGLRFLADFEPITDFDAAREVDGQLARGIVSGERVYARSVPVAVNSTYALRSVAYRGKVMRSVRGATYNELDFDRRRDVIVVFRIIDRDADGGITIVWRRLRVADTPKVNIPSRDGAKDPQT